MNPSDAVEGLAIAKAMRDMPWLYAAAGILHILGFVTLVGCVAVFDLRVLGLSKGIPVRALARHTLPWAVAALLVIVPTGLAMFAAHAAVLLASKVFQLKMALLLAAALNAAFFHTGPYVSVKSWDIDATAPLLARISVAVSLGLWAGVISCGRLLSER